MATTIAYSERDSKQLTDKERVFVDQYLVDMDVKNAAIRSGYSAKSAATIGWQILARPRVKKAIGHALLEMRVETRLNIDDILEQLQFILFRNVHQFVNMETGEALGMHQLSPEAAACVDGFEQEINEWFDESGKKRKSIKNKLKLVGKAGALDMAMKYRGLFNKDNEQKQTHVTLNFADLLKPPVIDSSDPVVKAMENLEETAQNKLTIEVEPNQKPKIKEAKTPIKKTKGK